MQNGTTYMVRPAHAAAVQVGHDAAHLGRVHPVVRWAGVDLALEQMKVRTPPGRRRTGRTAPDTSSASSRRSSCMKVPASTSCRVSRRRLLVGAVGKHHPVGLREFGDLLTQASSPSCLVGAVSRPGMVADGHQNLLRRFLCQDAGHIGATGARRPCIERLTRVTYPW